MSLRVACCDKQESGKNPGKLTIRRRFTSVFLQQEIIVKKSGKLAIKRRFTSQCVGRGRESEKQENKTIKRRYKSQVFGRRVKKKKGKQTIRRRYTSWLVGRGSRIEKKGKQNNQTSLSKLRSRFMEEEQRKKRENKQFNVVASNLLQQE